MQEKKWYVLYTASRAEKKVEKMLLREGKNVFLPLHRSKRKWSDRVKVVELPLFNSYIFVNCTDFELHSLTAVSGVARIVYYIGKPAVVKESEIEAIKEFVALADNNTLISEGDMVNIIGGAFDKVSGKVTRIKKKTAYLYIEALGATVCVEISQIDKSKNKKL